jgi:hypothetical protein
MNEPLKVGSTVWYIGNSGRNAEALPEDCTVRVTNVYDGLARLENGAVLHATELRGYITVKKVEDFGAIKIAVRPDRYQERKQEVPVDVPVRAFRDKAHWQQHVERTRAWATLLSRMQMCDQEDMEPFSVEAIEAAHKTLFGNLEI